MWAILVKGSYQSPIASFKTGRGSVWSDSDHQARRQVIRGNPFYFTRLFCFSAFSSLSNQQLAERMSRPSLRRPGNSRSSLDMASPTGASARPGPRCKPWTPSAGSVFSFQMRLGKAGIEGGMNCLWSYPSTWRSIQGHVS